MPTFWARTNPQTGVTKILKKPTGLVLKTGDVCCCDPSQCVYAYISGRYTQKATGIIKTRGYAFLESSIGSHFGYTQQSPSGTWEHYNANWNSDCGSEYLMFGSSDLTFNDRIYTAGTITGDLHANTVFDQFTQPEEIFEITVTCNNDTVVYVTFGGEWWTYERGSVSNSHSWSWIRPLSGYAIDFSIQIVRL